METKLTPFDFGFELANEPKLEKNLYNVGGNRCQNCPIKETCLLPRYHNEALCFEGVQKALTQTDVCKKVLKKESLSNEEVALHLYIDSMLNHLNTLTDPQKQPLDLFLAWDLRSDCALDEEKGGCLGPKYTVICRFFGRQVIDILRNRGYEL